MQGKSVPLVLDGDGQNIGSSKSFGRFPKY
jgi:hypothetical protein